MDQEFQLIDTADGSPSLLWSQLDGEAREPMHNQKGAFSESLFIYHSAIQFVTAKAWPPQFYSLGLGLGYNELIIAAHCLSRGVPAESILIETAESSQKLKDSFVLWLEGKAPSKDQLDWWRAYYKVSEMVAKHFGISSTDLNKFLAALYQNGQWQLVGALSDESTVMGKYSCILYDAFCSKSSPELWEESFLKDFIKKICRPNSVFVTYAAKGSLNRALRLNGFILEQQEGFGGKRESTFAIRVQN